jgi:protein-S-isoprenylcysteine O-methyltransferase Ste14
VSTAAHDWIALLATLPVAILVCLLVSRRWPVRTLSGAFLSYIWASAAQMMVDGVAEALGLWRLDLAPHFLATPLQPGIGLACLIGPLAFLALGKWRLSYIVLAVTVIDAGLFLAMAHASLPGVLARLCAVASIVASAQLLGRMTAANTRTRWRAAMQAVAWIALIFWLFPSAVLAQTRGSWSTAVALPPLAAIPLAAMFALFLLMGLSAVQEFALRGNGTPFPFDPPKRLVTSGAYAYVRNPMQLAICGCLLAQGALLASPWIALGAVEAAILFVVFKHVCAGTSTVKRDDPLAGFYQASVPAWLPRWRPSFVADERAMPADMLEGPASGALMRWLGRQVRVGLALDPKADGGYAFRSGDGRYCASGFAAIGQALQHVNLAVATIGWLLCLLPLSRHVTEGDAAAGHSISAISASVPSSQ